MVLSPTVLNTVAFPIFTVAPGSNCEPVIVPHVPAVVTTFGETAAMIGWSAVAGPVRGAAGGEETEGVGTADGSEDAAGNPPQFANASVNIAIPMRLIFISAARFLITGRLTTVHSLICSYDCSLGVHRHHHRTRQSARSSLSHSRHWSDRPVVTVAVCASQVSRRRPTTFRGPASMATHVSVRRESSWNGEVSRLPPHRVRSRIVRGHWVSRPWSA